MHLFQKKLPVQFVVRHLGLALLLSVLTAALSASAAERVTLMWDPSPDDTVTGYRVYCTDVTLNHSSQIDVGNTNTCIITNLIEGRTYQFYVTAYDQTGLESEPSNTLEFAVPLGPIETTIAAGPDGRPQMRLHADGSQGVRLALQTSTNLTNWITMVTASGAGESLDVAVTNLLGDEKRFFRTVVFPE